MPASFLKNLCFLSDKGNSKKNSFPSAGFQKVLVHSNPYVKATYLGGGLSQSHQYSILLVD